MPTTYRFVHGDLEFAVVTALPDDPTGNTAAAFGLMRRTDPGGSQAKYEEVTGPDLITLALGFGIPVFTLGEILILDRTTGREVDGRGRNPSKWAVTVERFDALEDAVARSAAVLEDDDDA